MMAPSSMAYTYILKLSSDKYTYYIGSCNDIDERIIRHRQGRVKFTKPFRPVELVYLENHDSKSNAIKREKYLKRLKSKKEIELLIKK